MQAARRQYAKHMSNKGVRDTTLYIIVLCGFFGMSGSLLFVVLFVIFMYLGNIIIKIFFQLATQGNLSGFTPFPAIIIDEPHYPNVKFVTYYHALCKKYFLFSIKTNMQRSKPTFWIEKI